MVRGKQRSLSVRMEAMNFDVSPFQKSVTIGYRWAFNLKVKQAGSYSAKHVTKLFGGYQIVSTAELYLPNCEPIFDN